MARQDGSFKKVDEDVQSLAIAFAKQSGSFAQLADLLIARQHSVKAHISHEFQEAKRRKLDTKAREEVLESLCFSEIYSRQECIKDAHAGTFEWIFDRSNEALRPWSPFVDWLEQGQGTYWISGKAGSGKSTLMNFVWQDPRTHTALEQWAGEKTLLTPVFYFWAAGSDLQRSITGLLRSLTYQILKLNPHIVEDDFLERFHPLKSRSIGRTGAPLPIWIEKRVATCLELLTSRLETTHRICFFIDGLDEFGEDHYDLVELIHKITNGSEIKCCLSSRPEKPFERFGKVNMLKLQDLTKVDIRSFVTHELERLPPIQDSAEEDDQYLTTMVNDVVEKAEGVFLWVELAVKSQVLGIRHGDSKETLHSRLVALPPKVEELYLHMLKRIDSFHVKEAAKLLAIVKGLIGYGIATVFRAAFTYYGCSDDLRLVDDPDINVIVNNCSRLRQRADAVCVGLLEVRDEIVMQDGDFSYDPTLFNQPSNFYVLGLGHFVFIHRTAKDFLETGQGRQFLDKHFRGHQDPLYLNSLTYLVEIKARLHNITVEGIRHLLCGIMESLYELSFRVTMASLIEFTDFLNESISALHRQWRSCTAAAESTWCQSWGYDAKDLLDFDGLWLDDEQITREHQLQYLPTDFLSLAAMWSLYGFVNYHLDHEESIISTERASQLAVCSTWVKSSHYSMCHSPKGPCRVISEAQLDVVLRLQKLGADLFLTDSCTSSVCYAIWAEVFSRAVPGVSGYNSAQSKRLEILDAFKKSSVGPNRILRLDYDCCQDVGIRPGKVRLELDAKIMSAISDNDGGLDDSVPNTSAELLQDRCPLRVRFVEGWAYNFELPRGGFCLSIEQAQNITRALLACVTAASDQRMSDAMEAFREILEELARELGFSPMEEDKDRVARIFRESNERSEAFLKSKYEELLSTSLLGKSRGIQ